MTDLLPMVVCCAVGTPIARMFLRCAQIMRWYRLARAEREHAHGWQSAAEEATMEVTGCRLEVRHSHTTPLLRLLTTSA